LLPRICKNVTVAVPTELGVLTAGCRTTAASAAPAVVEIMYDNPDLDAYDAILSIGIEARPDLPWTVINSNGWLVRVSSKGTDLPENVGLENPIASLAAASLGVSEVFKRLLRVKEARGRFFDGLTFSLYHYTNTKDPGPALSEVLPLNLAVFGAGAIGNGIIHLLRVLPTRGQVTVIDRQEYQPENLGTCLLIGRSNLGQRKALFAEAVLSEKVKARGFAEDIDSFMRRLGKGIEYPSVVLNALDNIDARRAVQDLWPDLVIDGAIGDFGCQVSRHPWGEDIACLKCLFQEPSESAETVAGRATGLSGARTQLATTFVTSKDVEAAPEHKKEWLQGQLGRPICSVVSEAVTSMISEEKQGNGFEPSVPFVACLSASMVVGELVKHICGLPTPVDSRFQFDVLQGPAGGQAFSQKRRKDCTCVTRRKNIDTIRQRRIGSPLRKERRHLVSSQRAEDDDA
jgi:molybdopterin/thiamine biosynthesis adenylyltransferase